MKINNIHRWNLTPREAIALQLQLRKQVRLSPLAQKKIRYVAGADIAVSKKCGLLIGAVVVMLFPSLEIVEARSSSSPVSFPYVPGLLSFREVPVLLQALKRIKTSFQVMLCDGQGIAHPRHLGLATHLGLLLKIPTVGCAKSRLVGEYAAVGTERGNFTPLKYNGRQVGCVLRTREGVKPLFVSPGHLIDSSSCRRIVLASTGRFRLPEPARHAHRFAGERKRAIEAI